jgi:hypothetical protein
MRAGAYRKQKKGKSFEGLVIRKPSICPNNVFGALTFDVPFYRLPE